MSRVVRYDFHERHERKDSDANTNELIQFLKRQISQLLNDYEGELNSKLSPLNRDILNKQQNHNVHNNDTYYQYNHRQQFKCMNQNCQNATFHDSEGKAYLFCSDCRADYMEVNTCILQKYDIENCDCRCIKKITGNYEPACGKHKKYLMNKFSLDDPLVIHLKKYRLFQNQQPQNQQCQY